MQREDLDEMLGNVLDNPCKWTRSQVALTSDLREGRVVSFVDDDGEGLPSEKRDEVLQRGTRADEAAPGSGLDGALMARRIATDGG